MSLKRARTATFLQVLKETAMRSGEAKRLHWTDIDFEKHLIRLNDPEKGSNPRIWRVSTELIAMLNNLPRKSEKVFGTGSPGTMKATYISARRSLAQKLQNPRLLRITFHTFRHWKATTLYHQTKDPYYVKDFLGHKSLTSTEIYISNPTKTTQTDIRTKDHKEHVDKAEQFLTYVRAHKSKNTFRVYEFGLKKFLGFVGKSGNEIIEDAKRRIQSEDRADLDFWKNRMIDFKDSLTNAKLTQNSARTQSTGPVSFFRYHGIVILLEKDFWEVRETVGDYVPQIEEYRRMYQTGDIRAKLLISFGLDLAWRIGDITDIKLSELPDLKQEPPLPFEKITEKEKVIGKSFLSIETVELLKAYIPTLKPENPFLFQNGNGSSIQDQSVNSILQTLAKKCGIQIPQGKTLRFHCFRKRFLSTCADCSIDENLARILTGKAVDKSMLAYLGEANLKAAWTKAHDKLYLLNGVIRSKMDSKDAEILKLQAQLDEQTLLLKAMTSLFGSEILSKAREQQAAMLGDKENLLKDLPSKLSPLETLRAIGQQIQLKEQAAYKKMIDENGNNH